MDNFYNFVMTYKYYVIGIDCFIALLCFLFGYFIIRKKELKFFKNSFISSINAEYTFGQKLMEMLLFFIPAYNIIYLISLAYNYYLILSFEKLKIEEVKNERKRYQEEMQKIDNQKEEKIVI
jgi:flagellar biosynthesis protein FlhB